MSASFLWHDYETWGNDWKADFPCQFAAIRTDVALNPLGEPLVVYCQPPLDRLPHPDACLITGLVPQTTQHKGIIEAEFAARIHHEMAQPGTCSVGYNSHRFDDHVSCFLFYRTLRDPYAHRYQHGNSRLDLIDVLRLAHALRPEGFEWPLQQNQSGASFQLGALAQANDIAHPNAHDALADVEVTIALARRLKHHQPRLFDYTLNLRSKHFVHNLLHQNQPLLHVSARYSAQLGCMAPVMAVAQNPSNHNSSIVFDLRQSPEVLLDHSPAEIAALVFTKREDLPAGAVRIALKEVKHNATPMLAPVSTLVKPNPQLAERWQIDPTQVMRHVRILQQHRDKIDQTIQQVYAAEHTASCMALPVEQALYQGGFIPKADRRRLDTILKLTPQALAEQHFEFSDPRLPELFFHYRARNWPQTLNATEQQRWRQHCAAQIHTAWADYQAQLDQLRHQHPQDRALFDQLAAWGQQLLGG